jgi:hypothetical protein
MKSRRAIRSSKARRRFSVAGLAPVPVLSLISATAVWWVWSHGWTLWYGDAEAHLNTARRIIDNQTPGYDQLGTVWLPLLHVMLLPFVRVDRWWHSGIAAAFPAAICFVIGGTFLYNAARRMFDSAAAGAAACGLAALNPNLLYLQSTAMTEAVFFAALMALFFFAVRFRETQGWGSVAGAGVAACAGALTRYEGWLVLPFAAAYFLWAAKRRRWLVALVFCVLAGAGPLYWMANDWYLTRDPLDFYRGPWSPRAIQGNADFPGWGNWRVAWRYFRSAAELCAGWGVVGMGVVGALTAPLRSRLSLGIALLAIPAAHVIWSMHSGVVPIFMPGMPYPESYYNTRYGLDALPLLAVCAAALVAFAPRSFRAAGVCAVLLIGSAHWLLNPNPGNWVTWSESRANSSGRRAWMREAAEYLGPRFVRGSGIIASAGDDFFGTFREMNIPLRETFTVVNGLPFLATVARPDLFLWQEWAVVKGGDDAQTAVDRAGKYGIRYRLEKRIIEKNEPVIEIYRRVGGMHGTP